MLKRGDGDEEEKKTETGKKEDKEKEVDVERGRRGGKRMEKDRKLKKKNVSWFMRGIKTEGKEKEMEGMG